MVLEIKRYIAQNKIVSLADLLNYFRVEEEALEPILNMLINKRFIQKRIVKCSGCTGGSCAGCTTVNQMIFYEKIETEQSLNL